MTNWLSITDAAERLHWSFQSVLQMAISDDIHSRQGPYGWEVCAGDVAALVEQQRPSVRGGPELDPTTEDQYRKEQST